jgi:hypothetical protein
MMGFLLAIIYLAVAYIGVDTVFGPLALYHVELILAALIFLVSLPLLPRSPILRAPQSLALIGLAFAVFVSVLMTGWTGGAVQSFLDFIPCGFAYFLVCLHCDSKRKLQVLVLMLVSVCLFVIVQGAIDLQRFGDVKPLVSGASSSPYLLAQSSDAGQWIYRLRGRNFINDPNDFAQLIVSVIPLVFIFWRPKKLLKNIGFVILPVCALLCGVFLTHSRGALLALVAVTVVAGRRRIGTLASVLLAGVLFVAASASGFTGGRDISADAGSDRASLWSQGLQVFKSHPLFGVGFGRLSEFTDVHLTAHNSIVVCAAELGFIGLFFWSLFVFPSVRDTVTIASTSKVSEEVPPASNKSLFTKPEKQHVPIDRAEINRLGRLVVLSLTGFLVAGWFLSRAYAMTLFLLGGVAEVVFQMALDRGMIAPRLRLNRVLPYTGTVSIGLIVIVYVVLRTMNLMH